MKIDGLLGTPAGGSDCPSSVPMVQYRCVQEQDDIVVATTCKVTWLLLISYYYYIFKWSRSPLYFILKYTYFTVVV